MATILFHNSKKNSQGEEEGGGREHVAAIHVRPTKAVIASIEGATSPIIALLANVIGAIKPSHQRQGNGILLK
jgi:hypothetical protein